MTKLEKTSNILDGILILLGAITFLYWFTGKGLFYSNSFPVMSPFTSLSLILMSWCRLAFHLWETWSKTLSLALLGVVSCGNFSSLVIQVLTPELFISTIPNIVPTSILTSIGLIVFCFYEILIMIRKTPRSVFIIDDILLHLALFPGGLSFLGHVLGVHVYMSSSVDPRVGVSYLEMGFMGTYAVAAIISNPNLFLWRFLKKSIFNRITFLLLFVNQYVAPIFVGWAFRRPETPSYQMGIEFYVMLAGVLATFVFLVLNAIQIEKEKF